MAHPYKGPSMLNFTAILAIGLLLHPAAGLAASSPAGCASPTQKIDEKGFVKVGGIEQWVTVKGDSCANPIVLFLHGGPGNTLSPYAEAIHGAWAKDFTLVQ